MFIPEVLHEISIINQHACTQSKMLVYHLLSFL